MRRQTTAIARGLGVRGLVNVQFALHEGTVYVIEANPRASRTVPFVEKAVGIDLVGLACRVALGERLADIGATVPAMIGVAVKEAVLPFARFPGADPVLGPEMRSTGEVMALAPDFPTAYAKASRAAGMPLPSVPNGIPRMAFLSVCDRDKSAVTLLAQRLSDLGLLALRHPRHGPGDRPARHRRDAASPRSATSPGEETVGDLIRDQRVDLIVNTPVGRGARRDGYEIRRAAISARIPCITTIAGASAAVTRSVAPRPSSRGRCRTCTRSWSPSERMSTARVLGVEPVGPYRLVRVGGGVVAGAPGRFHMVRALDGDTLLARPLSAVSEEDGVVGFLCEPRGAGRRGDRARGRRALGARTARARLRARALPASRPLLVGGGFGAALLARPGRGAAGRGPARGLPQRGARRGRHARARRASATSCSSPSASPTCWASSSGTRRRCSRRGPTGLVRAAAAAALAAGPSLPGRARGADGLRLRLVPRLRRRLDGRLVRLCLEGPVVDARRLEPAT